MRETIYLRFADRTAALDALRPLGLLALDPATGAETIPSATWCGEVRVDLDVPGAGDGVLWRDTGVTTIDPDTGEPSPVWAPIAGFHLDLLWWGATPPDFGTAVIVPETPSRVFAD